MEYISALFYHKATVSVSLGQELNLQRRPFGNQNDLAGDYCDGQPKEGPDGSHIRIGIGGSPVGLEGSVKHVGTVMRVFF